MNTVPTGFSAVPPSGPAMPLTAMPQVAPVRARTPSAISSTVGSLTAPCDSSVSASTSSRSRLSAFEYEMTPPTK